MDDIPLAPLPPPKNKPTAGPSTFAQSKPVLKPVERRGFFTYALAVIIGGLVGFVPVASGLAVFLDPLRRRGSKYRSLKVATLDALPADGIPRPFPVLSDRQDAWTHYTNEPVGAVYLRRLSGGNVVQAFNATCPHLGCFVAFKPDRKQFQCPCHTSAFEIDGKRVMPCVAARDMDSLECEVRPQGDEQVIFVKFANFYTGLSEKKAKV